MRWLWMLALLTGMAGCSLSGNKGSSVFEGKSDVTGADGGGMSIDGVVEGMGKTSLILLPKAGSSTAVMNTGLGQANGSFTEWSWTKTGLTGWGNQFEYHLADVNGDGFADLILMPKSGSSTATISVGLGQANGSFTTWSWTGDCGSSSWGTSFEYHFADVSGDGKVDLIILPKAGSGTSAMYVGLGQTNGSFAFWSWSYSPLSGWGDKFEYHFADVSGDGKADLILMPKAGGGQSNLYVGLGQANGSFAFWSWIGNCGSASWGTLFEYHFADVSGDGKTDLILLPKEGSSVLAMYVGLGQANGSIAFWSWSYSPLPGFGEKFEYHFADVSGDGKADLILMPKAGGGQSNLYVGLGQANGSFAFWSWTGSCGSTAWGTLFEFHFADVSGDGKADLILMPKAGGGVSSHYVGLGQANGSFAFWSWTGNCGSTTWGDQFTYLFAGEVLDGWVKQVDTILPTISVTAPANNAVISGSYAMTVSATDNVAVKKVEYYIDGVLKASNSVSPFGATLATTAYAGGFHKIYAKAYDAAGNSKISVTNTFRISNFVNVAPPVVASPIISNTRTKKIFGTLSDAYAMSMDGDVLMAQHATFDGRLNGAITRKIIVNGGYNAAFTAIAGYTVFAGPSTNTGSSNLICAGVMFKPTTAIPVPPYFSIFNDNYAYTFDGAIVDMFALPSAYGHPFSVVVVDTNYIKKTKAYPDSPYWWKLYMSTWTNGHHASEYIPSSLTGSETGQYDQHALCSFGINYPGDYESLTKYPGSYNTEYCKISSSHPFFTLRDPIYRRYKSGYNIYSTYHANHTLVAYGNDPLKPGFYQWVPFFSVNTGVSSPIAYNSSARISAGFPFIYPGINEYFWIQLKSKKVLVPADMTFNEVSYYETVVPGEVRKDGWAILPGDTNSLFYATNWVFFMPDGATLKEGDSTGGIAHPDFSDSSPELFSPPIYLTFYLTRGRDFVDTQVINEEELVYSYGDLDSVDISQNGKLVYVDTFGREWICSLASIMELVKAFGGDPIIMMNGSGNTFNGAVDLWKNIVRNEKRPVIGVYMAQAIRDGGSIAYGMSSWNTLNTAAKNVFMSVAAQIDYISSQNGTKWTAVSHSWSGHLVGEALDSMSAASKSRMKEYIAINPAHGSFGGANTSWESYLLNTQDKVKILAGENDIVSQAGMGVSYYKYLPGYGNIQVGSANVGTIDASRANVAQVNIAGAGHTIKSMMDHGAAAQIN